MSDNRGQWTSASAAEGDLLCPGKHLAQRGIPEPEKTQDCETGNRIHAALAGETVTLSADEQETMDKCCELEVQILDAWMGPEPDMPKCHKEERLWYEFGDLHHSGKPDVVYVVRSRALVLDYKTGRNDVTENPANLQLRDLACLVAHNYGVDEVTVAIIQPWATSQPPCVYGPGDLAEALQQMEERIVASNQPNALRVAGDAQCKYCRAKGTCPAFAAAALPVPAIPEKFTLTAAADVTLAIQGLSGERLGAFLALSRLASDVAEEEVRKRLDGGIAVDGWSFKPGRTTEKVTEPQKCFERFVLAGGTTEQFLQAVTVGKTKLKDAARAVTGTKGKALDAELAKLLDGLTEEKTSAPVLTRS